MTDHDKNPAAEETGLERFHSDPEDDIRPIETGPAQQAAPDIPRHLLPEDDHYFVEAGDCIDLYKKDPALRQVLIGVGWDQKALEENKIDVDVSCFLLNTKDMTRVDSDFIFYNNETGCEGAVRHAGDNRSGAGDGDDETLFMDLPNIPFDVVKIVFVLSIYDFEHVGHHFGMVRDVYFRLVNREDDRELLRYPLDETMFEGQTGVILGIMERNGPKWGFLAQSEAIEGGLSTLADRYGIIVAEKTG